VQVHADVQYQRAEQVDKGDHGEVRPFDERQRLGGAPSRRMESQVPSSLAELKMMLRAAMAVEH